MIEIFDLKGKKLKSIPNEEDFFSNISAGELLEDHPEYDETRTDWSFVVFKPEHVHKLYHHMKQCPITEPLRQAYIQQLGLIEIATGDSKNLTQISLSPDLNIGELKKKWYLAYCKSHGYTITKNSGSSDVDKLAADTATPRAELGDVQ